ncbi:hypothetical protein Anas_09573 [Armadillidium nasatum]|uniref:Uncharacterized protein n=1 Tax=Armadillidium nasatum TaxID=96803 RepID=A0A5N5SL79_9CRUS|nr:hypothetical protein Anas_09573 [Armadillidium nasatum]
MDNIHQLLRSQSALMFLTMGGYPGLSSASIEKSADAQVNTINRRIASEEVTRRKYSSLRGVSVLSDGSGDSNSASPHFSSSIHSHRSTIHNFVRQSHTVDSGLSTLGSDDCRPFSSSSDSKLKNFSDANFTDQNGMKGCSGGNSTDDADSANFTLGENNAIILDNCSVGSGSRNTPPQSPTVQSLQRMNKDEARRTPSDKVRTQRSRLRLLGKSYSQDEKGSCIPSCEKSINKFSSEPSLDLEELKTGQEGDQEISKPVSKKGILGRTRFFNKLKSKSDKNK